MRTIHFLATMLILQQTVILCQGQSYVAEGYFVVDDETVQSYVRTIPGTITADVKRSLAITELRKDIDYIVNEMNQLLSSMLSHNLSIEVRVRKLDILSSNMFLPGSLISNTINADTALKQFDSWIQTQNSFLNLKFDFAFLWTGYDLFGTAGIYTSGYAHVGKICDSKLATGVAEFNKTYVTALTTAHELGHILGSEHGGPATSSIMSPQLEPTTANRWFFSGCSAYDVKGYISSLLSNCLLLTDVASTKPTLTYGTYTGQMLDPDVVCQRTQNDSSSYMCKAWNLYNNLAPSGDRVCSQLYCSAIGTQYCYSAYPSEGMVCDANKRCKKGKCILDSTAPTNIDSKCVYGDQKMLELKSIGFYNTCQVYMKEKGSITCYQDTINQRCCNTCKTNYTGRVGCEYGDKSLDCINYSLDEVCPQYKDTLCCGYCYGYIPKRSMDSVQSSSPELNIPHYIHDPVFAGNNHGKDRGQE